MKNFYKNLIHQNNLLEQMNGLLQQQNNILNKNEGSCHVCEEWIKDLNRDEIRSGFLVTSHRKKLWNVQIGLVNEFARVCKKYNLKWFVIGGTLLGAVRHKGFIPWDDDFDVAMLRPDYNKFVQIAAKEFKPPYFLDNWYDYQRELEMLPSTPREQNLQLVLKEVENKYYICWPFIPFLKLRDLRTTMIEIPEAHNTHQCIWIDIFPLDSVPPLAEHKHNLIFLSLMEFLEAAIRPANIKKIIADGLIPPVLKNSLEMFLTLPYKQRGMYFDKLAEKNFGYADKLSTYWNFIVRGESAHIYDKNIFEENIYLPFESIEVSAPLNWEAYLKVDFDDWHKMIITYSHSKTYSADIPFSEYHRMTRK